MDKRITLFLGSFPAAFDSGLQSIQKSLDSGGSVEYDEWCRNMLPAPLFWFWSGRRRRPASIDSAHLREWGKPPKPQAPVGFVGFPNAIGETRKVFGDTGKWRGVNQGNPPGGIHGFVDLFHNLMRRHLCGDGGPFLEKACLWGTGSPCWVFPVFDAEFFGGVPGKFRRLKIFCRQKNGYFV